MYWTESWAAPSMGVGMGMGMGRPSIAEGVVYTTDASRLPRHARGGCAVGCFPSQRVDHLYRVDWSFHPPHLTSLTLGNPPSSPTTSRQLVLVL